ncbi:hypothetical protein RQP46_000784 [Phenoliferia psychrophenolica]
MSSSLSLSLHAIGLIVVYSLYGVLQEKIMRGVYGTAQEHFTSSSLLILCNRIFSVSTGLVIVFIRSQKRSTSGAPTPTFTSRLKPASPLVAVQLSVNYVPSSQIRLISLAKTAKMVPVLVVGALIYKKKHATKEWMAAGTIVCGCALYLFSHPPTSKHHAVEAKDDSFMSGILGTLCLLGYLFFDGLVSTTQERVFGKNPSSSDPFGPESPVLDQMIWTNTFAALIAIASALLTNVSGTLMPNVRLLLTTPALVWDVSVFSAASALGLIILLNTIASFGALTCSLIMTTRQFLSILINAGIFGNFSSVGLEGWTGVGWVASGIYIKMNKAYDPPKAPKGAPVKEGSADALHADELEGLASKELPSPASTSPLRKEPPRRMRQYFFQYCVPIAVPVVLALLLAPILYSESSNLDPFTGGVSEDVLSSDVEVEPVIGGAKPDLIAIEGGKWSAELHEAVSPDCHHNITTEPYSGKIRTGFVSFPRSGNSYVRSLVERATGFQTSSIYCDKGLSRTFLGECDHESGFFVKTHFPALPKKLPADSENYFRRFDQAVHLAIMVAPLGDHAAYWTQAPLLTEVLRYEDLKATPIPKMMSLLTFLLPSTDLPSLADLACMVESDASHEAYHSRKNSDFSSWDDYEPELRMEVLRLVRRPFCSFGYDRLLAKKQGELPEFQGFCDRVSYEDVNAVEEVADLDDVERP